MIIGFAFGYTLEIAGFGKSTKLAAQFYFKEMTVLKVMFGAIIGAMVLIFLTSALGLLDYNLIWVNPTYLWPGILGGLIMGFGFILGGFCPGTSLVSAATLKLDGIVFALGVFFGIFMFGETVGLYEDFWYSSYMGRFTLPELFNADTGIVVLALVLIALLAFVGAELAEKYIGKMDSSKEPRYRYALAGAVVLIAVVGLLIGQPTNADKWATIAPEEEVKLTERAVQIEPAELLQTMSDRRLIAYMIDVRDESDFNEFHLIDAHHIPLDQLLGNVAEMHFQPANTVFVVMSNDETQATEAWRMLKAESVPNVYILAGGINNWIATYADATFKSESQVAVHEDEQLGYTFAVALGSRNPAANPNPDMFPIEYTPRIQLELKRGPTSGGCG
ncbi:MAG: YeeE/YedE family protein [Anaerolineae bacterium]|nr:YeeE/YedE family protein [Anaerolineae bacterium]MCA9907614.1 YeeE/YedE family protein [Anaerolineae bacterium]